MSDLEHPLPAEGLDGTLAEPPPAGPGPTSPVEALSVAAEVVARAPEPVRGEAGPAFAAPTPVALSHLDESQDLRLRDEGDVSALATSLARIGQIDPIDVRAQAGRLQVIDGFRRLKALRLLQRDRVLARIHEHMGDGEALLFALARSLEQKGLSEHEIRGLRERLQAEGRLSSQARGLIDAALVPPGSDLEPEGGAAAEEVDLDELAADLTQRLAAINQDLALVIELWSSMEPSGRVALLEQLRYPAELFDYLRSLR